MNKEQFTDLAKLAIERCRESVMSVAQLIDNDKERAAMLMSVANDMIDGAANLIEDDETTEDEALGAVVTLMFHGLGPERMQRALNSDALKAIRAKRGDGK